MNQKDILKLKPGDKVGHNHYKKVTVVELLFDQNGGLFGIKILPAFWRHRLLLSSQSGMHPNVPLLETSYRLLKALK